MADDIRPRRLTVTVCDHEGVEVPPGVMRQYCDEIDHRIAFLFNPYVVLARLGVFNLGPGAG